MLTDECPGVGKCHNASWCADCDVTALGPCDARARGERCDRHPGSDVLRPLLEEVRHAAACADLDAAEALTKARAAEAVARRQRDEANRLERQLQRRHCEAGALQAKLTAALADEQPRA